MKHASFHSFLFLASLFFCGKTLGQSHDYRVRFKSGTAVFPENLADFQAKPSISTDETFDGQAIRFIQFYELPDAAARQRMADMGLRTLDYVSYGTWRTVFPAGFDHKKMTSLGIRSVMPVETKWKLARSLTERPLGEWAVTGERVAVIAQVVSTLSQGDATRLFKEKKVEITKTGTQNGIYDLLIPIADIEKVADLPFIKWLEIQPKPSVPEDTHGRSMHRSNAINNDAGNLHFDGTGVNVMTRDDGAVGPHIDFKGRITNVSENTNQFSNHGDGTAGVLAGGGNLDPTQQGMASGSKIWVVDYASDFQDTTLPLCLAEHILVTNTSYSDGCNAGYDSHAQTVDQQLFNNPMLMHSFSAGNQGLFVDCGYGAGQGWGNITGGHKMAKNALATANLYADFTLESSSSRGPATDGRLKPDLSAHGQEQGSTDADNTYQIFGGTSAASPGTAGTFSQLIGAFKATHGGVEPSAGLVKAALLNTANDLGNPGPDFQYGWGHLNALRAFNLLKDNHFYINTIDNGGTNTQLLTVPVGVKLAKIMVYWPDPESDLAGAKALVNDLDLLVFAPGGATLKPLVLNSDADPDLLSAPAAPGEDHLNNMEQVSIADPAPGDYLVQISGFEVPQGPSRYFLVYEFLTDEVQFTYPIGGEGMVPGEKELVHWDAFGKTGEFSIELSTDGGASWNFVTEVAPTGRHFEWTVPSAVSGNCLFRIKRDGKEFKTPAPFTIITQPDTLLIDKVCPTKMTLTWPAVAGADRYDVFMLGQTRMDSIGTTGGTSLTFPINDPSVERWLSVRADPPTGQGRRITAVKFPGGLVNCPQPNDLRLIGFNEPSTANLISCSPFQQPVSVKITNDGTEAASYFPVTYLFGNNPPVTELFIGNLLPGATADFVFSQKIDLQTSLSKRLKAFSELPGETVQYNDSLALNLSVDINAGVGFGVKEPFEGAVFPPAFWSIENPDGTQTWALSELVVGIDGNDTHAATVNIFNYPDTTEVDHLRTPPFDLTGLATPLLVFDLAYARYTDPAYFDCLRVDAFGNCGADGPVTIWHRCSDDLSTADPQGGQFAPTASAQWQQQLVDLSQFSGQKVVFRFTLENGYGNNIYLDNIGILNEPIVAPLASFAASADTICRGDTVTYTSQSTGTAVAYNWAFGAGASPATALTAGPHKVKYPTVGTKTINLTVKNGIGEATASRKLVVRSAPVANFNSAANLNTVTFANTTTAGTAFLWNFGDGTTSTDVSPVHDYAATGNYQVSLTATSICGTNTKVKTVSIIALGTDEPTAAPGCQIQPNPNDGAFVINFNRIPSAGPVLVSIFSGDGRALRQVELELNQTSMSYPMSEIDLPKGLYQVVVDGGSWRQMVKMVVQ